MSAKLIDDKPGHALIPSSYVWNSNSDAVNSLYASLPFKKATSVGANVAKIVSPVSLTISDVVYTLDAGVHYIPFNLALFSSVICNEEVGAYVMWLRDPTHAIGESMRAINEIHSVLLDAEINLILPPLKLEGTTAKISYGCIGAVELPKDKQFKEWSSKVGNKCVRTDYASAFLYSHDIATIRQDPEFQKLCKSWDKEWIRTSNPPCIAVTFHYNKANELADFLERHDVKIDGLMRVLENDASYDGTKDRVADATKFVNELNRLETMGVITPFI